MTDLGPEADSPLLGIDDRIAAAWECAIVSAMDALMHPCSASAWRHGPHGGLLMLTRLLVLLLFRCAC